MLMLMNFSNLALVTALVDTNINYLSTKLLHVCVQIFSVNVLSTSGTPYQMVSVSTLFIGFVVVSCVLICLATFRIVVSLVDFHFVLSFLRVLLILSRLFRATISFLFVHCCPVLLSSYLVLFYMFERNKWRWRMSRSKITSFEGHRTNTCCVPAGLQVAACPSSDR